MFTPRQGQYLNFGCWKPLSGPKSLREGERDEHDLHIQLRCGCPALSTTSSPRPGRGPHSDWQFLLAPTSQPLAFPEQFLFQLYHRACIAGREHVRSVSNTAPRLWDRTHLDTSSFRVQALTSRHPLEIGKSCLETGVFRSQSNLEGTLPRQPSPARQVLTWG